MKSEIRRHFSYANVMATIAVFIALGGGAYAASIPKNSVGPSQLKNRAVTSAKIKDGSVTGPKLQRGSLTAAAFPSGRLPSGVSMVSPNGLYSITVGNDGIVLQGANSSVVVGPSLVNIKGTPVRIGSSGSGCLNTAAIWGLSSSSPSTSVKIC